MSDSDFDHGNCSTSLSPQMSENSQQFHGGNISLREADSNGILMKSDSSESDFYHENCSSSLNHQMNENFHPSQKGNISIRKDDTNGILMMSVSNESDFDHGICSSSSDHQMSENSQPSPGRNICSGTIADLHHESDVANHRVFQHENEADINGILMMPGSYESNFNYENNCRLSMINQMSENSQVFQRGNICSETSSDTRNESDVANLKGFPHEKETDTNRMLMMLNRNEFDFDKEICSSSSDDQMSKNSQASQGRNISTGTITDTSDESDVINLTVFQHDTEADTDGMLMMSESNESDFQHGICGSSSNLQMSENSPPSPGRNTCSRTIAVSHHESDVANLRVFQHETEGNQFFHMQPLESNSVESTFNGNATNPFIIPVLSQQASPSVSNGKTGAESVLAHTGILETQENNVVGFMNNQVTSRSPTAVPSCSLSSFSNSELIVSAANPSFKQSTPSIGAGSSSSNLKAQGLLGANFKNPSATKQVSVNEEKRREYMEKWRKFRNGEKFSKKNDLVDKEKLLKRKNVLEKKGPKEKNKVKHMKASSSCNYESKGLFGENSQESSTTKEVSIKGGKRMEYMEKFRKWRNGEIFSNEKNHFKKKELVKKKEHVKMKKLVKKKENKELLKLKRALEKERLKKKSNEKSIQEKKRACRRLIGASRVIVPYCVKHKWEKTLKNSGCLICPVRLCSRVFFHVPKLILHLRRCADKHRLDFCRNCDALLPTDPDIILRHMKAEHPWAAQDYEHSYKIINGTDSVSSVNDERSGPDAHNLVRIRSPNLFDDVEEDVGSEADLLFENNISEAENMASDNLAHMDVTEIAKPSKDLMAETKTYSKALLPSKKKCAQCSMEKKQLFNNFENQEMQRSVEGDNEMECIRAFDLNNGNNESPNILDRVRGKLIVTEVEMDSENVRKNDKQIKCITLDSHYVNNRSPNLFDDVEGQRASLVFQNNVPEAENISSDNSTQMDKMDFARPSRDFTAERKTYSKTSLPSKKNCAQSSMEEKLLFNNFENRRIQRLPKGDNKKESTTLDSNNVNNKSHNLFEDVKEGVGLIFENNILEAEDISSDQPTHVDEMDFAKPYRDFIAERKTHSKASLPGKKKFVKSSMEEKQSLYNLENQEIQRLEEDNNEMPCIAWDLDYRFNRSPNLFDDVEEGASLVFQINIPGVEGISSDNSTLKVEINFVDDVEEDASLDFENDISEAEDITSDNPTLKVEINFVDDVEEDVSLVFENNIPDSEDISSDNPTLMDEIDYVKPSRDFMAQCKTCSESSLPSKKKIVKFRTEEKQSLHNFEKQKRQRLQEDDEIECITLDLDYGNNRSPNLFDDVEEGASLVFESNIQGVESISSDNSTVMVEKNFVKPFKDFIAERKTHSKASLPGKKKCVKSSMEEKQSLNNFEKQKRQRLQEDDEIECITLDLDYRNNRSPNLFDDVEEGVSLVIENNIPEAEDIPSDNPTHMDEIGYVKPYRDFMAEHKIYSEPSLPSKKKIVKFSTEEKQSLNNFEKQKRQRLQEDDEIACITLDLVYGNNRSPNLFDDLEDGLGLGFGNNIPGAEGISSDNSTHLYKRDFVKPSKDFMVKPRTYSKASLPSEKKCVKSSMEEKQLLHFENQEIQRLQERMACMTLDSNYGNNQSSNLFDDVEEDISLVFENNIPEAEGISLDNSTEIDAMDYAKPSREFMAERKAYANASLPSKKKFAQSSTEEDQLFNSFENQDIQRSLEDNNEMKCINTLNSNYRNDQSPNCFDNVVELLSVGAEVEIYNENVRETEDMISDIPAQMDFREFAKTSEYFVVEHRTHTKAAFSCKRKCAMSSIKEAHLYDYEHRETYKWQEDNETLCLNAENNQEGKRFKDEKFIKKLSVSTDNPVQMDMNPALVEHSKELMVKREMYSKVSFSRKKTLSETPVPSSSDKEPSFHYFEEKEVNWMQEDIVKTDYIPLDSNTGNSQNQELQSKTGNEQVEIYLEESIFRKVTIHNKRAWKMTELMNMSDLDESTNTNFSAESKTYPNNPFSITESVQPRIDSENRERHSLKTYGESVEDVSLGSNTGNYQRQNLQSTSNCGNQKGVPQLNECVGIEPLADNMIDSGCAVSNQMDKMESDKLSTGFPIESEAYSNPPISCKKCQEPSNIDNEQSLPDGFGNRVHCLPLDDKKIENSVSSASDEIVNAFKNTRNEDEYTLKYTDDKENFVLFPRNFRTM